MKKQIYKNKNINVDIVAKFVTLCILQTNNCPVSIFYDKITIGAGGGGHLRYNLFHIGGVICL